MLRSVWGSVKGYYDTMRSPDARQQDVEVARKFLKTLQKNAPNACLGGEDGGVLRKVKGGDLSEILKAQQAPPGPEVGGIAEDAELMRRQAESHREMQRQNSFGVDSEADNVGTSCASGSASGADPQDGSASSSGVDETQSQGSAQRWLPIQVKVTKAMTPAWRRKMKHILNHQKHKLREVVLVGISLREEDPALVHLVHRNRVYENADLTSANFMTDKNQVCERLLDLWITGQAGTSTPSPARSFTFSTATLVEIEARDDFMALLEGTGLHYSISRVENEAVDGYVWLDSDPGTKYRVQEKCLSWRYERGKPIGLRCSLRRASGRNYSVTDADFLLLHARMEAPGTGTEFRIFGSALISWKELQENGYLYEGGNGHSGRSILSMYPPAPGVAQPRNDWAERCFFSRDEIATGFTEKINATSSGHAVG
eukprot:g8528.t1